MTATGEVAGESQSQAEPQCANTSESVSPPVADDGGDTSGGAADTPIVGGGGSDPAAPSSDVQDIINEQNRAQDMSEEDRRPHLSSRESANRYQEQVSDTDTDADHTYHLKWIPWNSGKIPIVMQSINGPCPLIAIMNVLLLREKVKLFPMLEQITATQLLTYLGECIMDSMPDDMKNDENAVLNYEQNIHDAIEILPKLKDGLYVNIRFTGITDFEYTPEHIIFDLLRIPIYHGWLSDPELIELSSAIGKKSYNQLVDYIITNRNSQDAEISTKLLIIEEFLERSASQLTLFGLNELKSRIKDNEIGILFRNNHFLTLFKRDDQIYTLVTDHGYLTEDNIVWEILDNIEGAGMFFDSNFQIPKVTTGTSGGLQAKVDKCLQQLENDYLMALSLKAEDSLANGGTSESGADFMSAALAKPSPSSQEVQQLIKSLDVKHSDSQNKQHQVNLNDENQWPQLGHQQKPTDKTAADDNPRETRAYRHQDRQTKDRHPSQRDPTTAGGMSGSSSSRNINSSSSSSSAQHFSPEGVLASFDYRDLAHEQNRTANRPEEHQRPPPSRVESPSGSQQLHRSQSAGGNRRPKSERSQKDSNCTVS